MTIEERRAREVREFRAWRKTAAIATISYCAEARAHLRTAARWNALGLVLFVGGPAVVVLAFAGFLALPWAGAGVFAVLLGRKVWKRFREALDRAEGALKRAKEVATDVSE